jgi:hypothetical protein
VGGGAAGYVFKQIGSDWRQVDKLVPGPTNPGTFGADVAIDRDTVLIGANSDSERALYAGSVFVFRRDSFNPSNPDKWFHADKLVATDGATYDSFGGAVSLRGDLGTAMIGAIGFVGDDAPPGAAYFCQIFFQPPSDAACRRSRLADPVLNAQMSMTDVTTSSAASQFTIRATLTNHGAATIRDLFFQVTELSGGNRLLNADGGPGGVGATMTPDTGDGGFLIGGGTSIRVTFVIGLASTQSFRFRVNVRGDPKGW